MVQIFIERIRKYHRTAHIFFCNSIFSAQFSTFFHFYIYGQTDSSLYYNIFCPVLHHFLHTSCHIHFFRDTQKLKDIYSNSKYFVVYYTNRVHLTMYQAKVYGNLETVRCIPSDWQHTLPNHAQPYFKRTGEKHAVAADRSLLWIQHPF